MVTIKDVQEARQKVDPFVRRTPLLPNDTLNKRLGTNVYLKYELFQKTGSFKPRGAFNQIFNLSDKQKEKGVVAVSGGNFAQGVAYAALMLGLRAIICMPSRSWPATGCSKKSSTLSSAPCTNWSASSRLYP